jgi:hypothetical protein
MEGRQLNYAPSRRVSPSFAEFPQRPGGISLAKSAPMQTLRLSAPSFYNRDSATDPFADCARMRAAPATFTERTASRVRGRRGVGVATLALRFYFSARDWRRRATSSYLDFSNYQLFALFLAAIPSPVSALCLVSLCLFYFFQVSPIEPSMRFYYPRKYPI